MTSQLPTHRCSSFRPDSGSCSFLVDFALHLAFSSHSALVAAHYLAFHQTGRTVQTDQIAVVVVVVAAVAVADADAG